MTDATRGGAAAPLLLNLRERLERLARTPRLLVACDYDGTLAPIVDNPADARPIEESLVALRILAEQPNTHVAIISGRALEDLRGFIGSSDGLHLVGSHGSEFEVGFVSSLDDAQRRLLERVKADLARIADAGPGLTIETKPASAALHFRNAPPDVGRDAVREVEQGPGALPGVHVKHGKMVIELAVVGADKGRALRTIRERVGAHSVLFIGDDVTDEDAFATLRGPDVGVKVGPGESAAPFRVHDPRAVSHLLAELSERRNTWLHGGESVPIERHALLSDQRAIALVSEGARICWLCAPRVDHPAIFAELIGGPDAGYFSVGPASGQDSTGQRYEANTLLATTAFDGFEVTDYLDCSGGRPVQRAGRTDLVRVLKGTGRVRIEFAPRLDFGRASTRLRVREAGVDVLDSPDPIALYAPGIDWRIEKHTPHETAVAEVDLDGEITMVLRMGGATLRAPAIADAVRLRETADFWARWASDLCLPRIEPALVARSALTLRALVHGPSGGMAAAATTSLPETIGGVRNWDYRYCWPRDAAIGAAALVKLGSVGEAMHLLDWLLGVVERATSPDRLHPIYTVTGEELPIEGEIGELSGYAGSRPVRVGNAASRQVQLDVFGPITDLVHELALRDAPLTPQHWRLVEAMVSAVTTRWREPDHGIWEIRDTPRHHVHSKVMCWETMDRAIRSAALLRDAVPAGWEHLRDQMRADILANGVRPDTGAFGAWYDDGSRGNHADAATLVVGLSGMLEAGDERFARTVEHVEKDLLEGSGLYRYRCDDNLPGEEGVFNLCTCWLVLSHLALGHVSHARELFADYVALAGPTGLLAEEHDVRTDRALGNFPQAYSHAGLIECAVALSEAGDPA